MLQRMKTILAAAVLTGGSAAQGGFLEDVGLALRATAFTIDSRPNPLSGGREIFIGRNFVGNELDFGPWDLTLQGPLSMQVSSGGRALSELEFSFTTATNSQATVSPLSYVLNYDVGGQETQIAGSLLIDGDLEFNGFGFYELSLTYSSRQNVTRDGRFANDEREFDADVGPIVVSGNIFADALAIITQPIFQAIGQENPFASFSGTAKLTDAIAMSIEELQNDLAAGITPADAGVSPLKVTSPGYVPTYVPVAPTAGAQVVPEPTVLILMLLGIPLLLARRRRASGN
jgi:hypothetical protein